MTRLTRCVVVFTALLLLLSGVGLAEPVTITFLGPSNLSYMQAFELLTDQFNEMQDQVQVEFLPGGGDVPRNEAFLTMAAGGVTPDVTWHYTAYEYASQGLILPLDERLERDGISDWAPGFTTWSTYEGVTYAAPYGFNVWGMIVTNRPVFQEVGLPDPPEGWTWDDFKSMGQRLKRVDSDGTVTRYAIADPPTYWWFWPWMVTNAARFVDMETGEWYPDRARTVESLEFHREIGIDLQLRGGALGGFQDGDVAMLMSSIPQEPILRDGVASGEYGIIHMPVNRLRAVGRSDYALMLGRTNDTARQDAAWTFVSWLLEPEQQTTFAQIAGLIPTRMSTIEYDGFQRFAADRPLYQAFVNDTVQSSVPYPMNDGFSRFRDVTTQWVGRMFNEGLSPAAVVETMHQILNAE